MRKVLSSPARVLAGADEDPEFPQEGFESRPVFSAPTASTTQMVFVHLMNYIRYISAPGLAKKHLLQPTD